MSFTRVYFPVIFFCLVFRPISEALSPGMVDEITRTSTDMAAPFTQTAVDRLHNLIFGGNPRAARSTDVVVMNRSNKRFTLRGTSCDSGGFEHDLFPEYDLSAKSSIFFGTASHGFLTGAICTATYCGEDATFWVHTRNPYIGANVCSSGWSDNIHVHVTKGSGNNNMCRFVIS